MSKPKLKHKYRLSHHGHSGRLRPHEYTSYGPLGMLLLVVGVLLLGTTVFAATPYDGPEAHSVSLTGTLPEPPPKTAATIVSPAQGQHFGTSPITVSGTCPANTLVEVYKNDIFAGSTPCSDSGSFSFKVDLLIGQNVLIARVYDSLNQPGPDSNAVTVYYDALPPQGAAITPLSLGGSQLLISTDAVYRGTFPGRELSMPVQVLGGTPPYAINIQWGDSKNSVIARSDNLTFSATHTYLRAGTYQITIQATDARGQVAFLSVVAIVNGQPAAIPASTTTGPPISRLILLWPLYTALIAIVTSFWLGERRERQLILAHPLRFHLEPEHRLGT
jgi:hypothetical protein